VQGCVNHDKGNFLSQNTLIHSENRCSFGIVDSYTFYLDDAGNSSFKGQNRFWVMGGVIVPDSWWFKLHSDVRAVLNRWKVPDRTELKWSDAGIRIKQIEAGDPKQVPKKQTPIAHLTTKDDIRQLFLELLDTLQALPGIRVMCVWCVKDDAKLICSNSPDPDGRCYRDMFHDVVERYEYFLTTGENEPGAYGHIVMDEKSKKFDKTIRHTCSELINRGTAFTNIHHVIDGVHISPSGTSLGIRMADYVAGAINSHLEYNYSGYVEHIMDNFHRDYHGNIDGVGAKRFPSQQKLPGSPVLFPKPSPPDWGF
jgi:hypothetical protein